MMKSLPNKKLFSRREALSTAAKIGIGVGIAAVVGGIVTYFATRPPTVIERTVTVEKPVERTVITTISGGEVTKVITETRRETITSVLTTEAPKKGITVILPKHEMDIIGWWETKTAEFEEKTGIPVTLVRMPWEYVADKVLAAMAAKSSEYDVIELDNAWVAKFAEAGWATPLEDYPGAREIMDGHLPGLINKFSYKGHFCGVTWNNDSRYFMYNKAMFEAAGIAAPPKTWDEFVEQCEALKGVIWTDSAGEKRTLEYPVAGAWQESQIGLNEFAFFAYTHGGEFFDENMKCVVNQGGTVEALEFMVDLINKGYVAPGYATNDYEMQLSAFLAGDATFMYQAWGGVYGYSLEPSLSKIVGMVEVAPLVPCKPGAKPWSMTLPEAMAIPKFSKNKEDAWEYIRFMASKEVNKEMCLKIGALPLWKDLYEDPDVLNKYPYFKGIMEQNKYLRGHPDLVWYDEWATKLATEFSAAIVQKKKPKEALDEVYKWVKESYPEFA